MTWALAGKIAVAWLALDVALVLLLARVRWGGDGMAADMPAGAVCVTRTQYGEGMQ